MDTLDPSNLELDAKDQAILRGEQGPALQKAMRSVVLYGAVFGAQRLVPITGAPHLVTSFGANVIQPYFDMVNELIAARLTTPRPFTVDPRPTDTTNVPYSLLEKLALPFLYGKQAAYEQQLACLGLRDSQAFTCTCYLPEVGNCPRSGDILAWSESSAVVYANSVLGARTNRNSAGIDLLCNLLGKAPLFGLLTDAGRRATWHIHVQTTTLPNPQLLGSAIGMRVVEAVPYITGLDHWLGTVDIPSYLKDMGAAAASNGAVGLYHVENITPEAIEAGKTLLEAQPQTYLVTDAELERVLRSYPILWRRKDAQPERCFIGCPHLSLPQLRAWATQIPAAVQQAGKTRVQVETILCAAPAVINRFKQFETEYRYLAATGVRLSAICPLMYLNNPLSARRAVITNSNKLRTYSTARFFLDQDIVNILTEGR
jgi:hypothetical protein